MNPHTYWLNEAAHLAWDQFPTQSLQGTLAEVNYTWFADGTLNAAHNAVHRHLPLLADKIAIYHVGDEPGHYQSITYRELSQNIYKTAAKLQYLGVKKGDRVCIYLPMIPQIVYSMLACAHLGAIHNVVFAGFSATSLASRMQDAECKFLITAASSRRGGKVIPLKKIVDEAITQYPHLDKIMWMGSDAPSDIFPTDLPHPAPAVQNAEDPLFILYTSGSTGKPKGVLHTTGGYLTYINTTFKQMFNIQPNDIYFCTADCGWITGHSYLVYAPLMSGITTVLFESTPTYPTPLRLFEIIEHLKVNILYTAPTALRSLHAQLQNQEIKHDLTTLRILGTVGEPIDPSTWQWYYTKIGNSKCPIIDTWWQTETGGVLMCPPALPSELSPLPGSAHREIIPYLKPQIIDGALYFATPWPSLARTVWNDHQRFVSTYFSQKEGLYFTGDGAYQDQQGRYFITGRIDDVLNVSGHRIGTAEVESALLTYPAIKEAAVVGIPHSITGEALIAFVVGEQIETKLAEQAIIHQIGKFARLDKIHIVPGLPKTRSGKVMRRILKLIARGETTNFGDTSSLSDPEILSKMKLS